MGRLKVGPYAGNEDGPTCLHHEVDGNVGPYAEHLV